jgi:hypothetical protein
MIPEILQKRGEGVYRPDFYDPGTWIQPRRIFRRAWQKFIFEQKSTRLIGEVR